MPDQNDARRAAALRAAAQTRAPSAGPQGWTPVPWAEFAAELARSHPHYRVTDHLGQGGMGAVYRATDTRDGTVLAIKMIQPGFLSDPLELARFRREIAILRTVNHPNIVKILDDGATPDGHHFFVMPYLGERTLRDYATGPRLPTPRILRIMQQLCAGVAHAHAKGIIHRDLKPANVMLLEPDPADKTPEERAVIVDYGIARALVPVDAGGTLSRVGDTPGTHGYLAPERKDGREAGPAADVFSLGVIFYQLVTGRVPDGAPTPLADFGLDPRFDAILAKALRQDPAERYQSASELAQAIAGVAAPAAAAPLPSSSPSSSSAKSAADDEYPTPDPASIVIEFNETSLVVNGLDFSLTTTIEDWLQVFGRYSEAETSDDGIFVSYFWHNLGVCVRTFYHETETLYIAPSNTETTLFNCQKAKFGAANKQFSSFEGALYINGKLLVKNPTISLLKDVDKRFKGSDNESHTRNEYKLNRWSGRLDFSSSIASFNSGALQFNVLTQDASIHLVEKLSSRLSEALYWVAEAMHVEAGQHAETVVLLSFTRLYRNYQLKNNGLAGGDGGLLKSGILLATKERPLIHLVGDRDKHYNGVKFHNDCIYPREILLTSHRLVIAESDRDLRSFYLAEKPVIGVISFRSLFGTKKWTNLTSLIILSILARKKTMWRSFWEFSVTGRDGVHNYILAASNYWHGENVEFNDAFVHDSGYRGDAGTIINSPTFTKMKPLLSTDRRYEFGHLALFFFWLQRINNEPLLKFPSYRLDAPNADCKKSSPTEVYISHLNNTPFKATGWRQKLCSSCQQPMSRFGEKCQKCGHPNTWLKMQTFAANVALLLSGLAGLFFGFLGFPLILFGLALVWRLTLAGLKTFYSH